MQDYLNVFIDEEYPSFLDKYLSVKTLKRIQHVTQFCGCDYTGIYNPRFRFTRFDHSLVVGHMTWHFTHDKKACIAALLHDVATPCFAHAIDYAMGDYMEQESSERSLVDVVSEDEELLSLLAQDGISLADLKDLSSYPALENKSPRLCTDRLDGVLHTTYVWLNEGSIFEVAKVYGDMCMLTGEDGKSEIGFRSLEAALEFVRMTETYALELQGNRDKFILEYVARVVKAAIENGLFSIDDLYRVREEEIVDILRDNFESWRVFEGARQVCEQEMRPEGLSVSVEVKKRNVIPLVKWGTGAKRIDEVSEEARQIYERISRYRSKKYAFVPGIDSLSLVRTKRFAFDKKGNL